MKQLVFSTSEIESIKMGNPLRQGFFYYLDKWQTLSPEYKLLLSAFENKQIKRADVVKSYQDYFKTHRNPITPFLLTMVWGHTTINYGNYRTDKLLAPENHQYISAGIQAAKAGDLKNAFNSLKKIKGLGVSYISKVLYFASKAAGITDYALIFDIRVANALVKKCVSSNIFELVTVAPSNKLFNYLKYNSLIHSLARQHTVEPDAIELFLFNLTSK